MCLWIKMVISYFKLVQVGGGLPVLVITDARHAGKADRDAISRVHFGFGELSACDLPDRCLLQQRNHNSSNINDKAIYMTASPWNEFLLQWGQNPWLLLFKERLDFTTEFQTRKPERVISIKCFQSLKLKCFHETVFSKYAGGKWPPSSAAWVVIISICLRVI